MKDQQRLVQTRDVPGEILLRDVIEQLSANAERPAGERDLDLTLGGDLADTVAEQADDVRRIERRADRHHGARLGDAVSGGKHGGTAKTMPNQDRGRRQHLPKIIGGGDQIIDIRREGSVGELPFAGAKPGEIEPQHGDAVKLQALGDVACRSVLLAARKAMREQRNRARGTIRPVKQRSKLLTLGVRKIEPFRRHRHLLKLCQRTPIFRTLCRAMMEKQRRATRNGSPSAVRPWPGCARRSPAAHS